MLIGKNDMLSQVFYLRAWVYYRGVIMIKTAGELIAKAQTRISCLDVSSAKMLYEGSKSIIIDVREPEDAVNSKLKDSINIPPWLNWNENIESLSWTRHIDITPLCRWWPCITNGFNTTKNGLYQCPRYYGKVWRYKRCFRINK